MEIEEFFEICSLNYRTTIRYGKILTEKSQPCDTAENIYAFLNTVLNEIDIAEKVISRKILIEKRKQKLSPSF
ncbi:MAG: hypothetical protein Q8L90_10760 [Bacteroidota bacterium]|nr:hypothetical protein [Bacteroidota bacterium]